MDFKLYFFLVKKLTYLFLKNGVQRMDKVRSRSNDAMNPHDFGLFVLKLFDKFKLLRQAYRFDPRILHNILQLGLYPRPAQSDIF